MPITGGGCCLLRTRGVGSPRMGLRLAERLCANCRRGLEGGHAPNTHCHPRAFRVSEHTVTAWASRA